MELNNFDGYEYFKRYITPSLGLAGGKIHNLNVFLVHHCNLNCKHCIFFSPVAKPVLPDSKELERDLRRISELTKDNPIENLFLMGGEPLLNPDLIYFMKLSRELFPKTILYVYTNGLLVEEQSEEFWTTLKENNMILLLSRYFSNDEFYENIKNIANKYGCKDLVQFSMSATGVSLFAKNQLQVNHPCDAEEKFNTCPAQLHCLNRGKLYSCQICALLYILEEKFHAGFKLFEEDGIDIYTHTFEEVIDFLRKPKKTCQYCNKNAFKCLYYPERSEFKRDEWIED